MVDQPDWLKDMEHIIPLIQDVAKQCDQSFQVKCFELLLNHALGDVGGEAAAIPIGIPTDVSRPFVNLLREHDIGIEDLGQIMDIATGDVFVADLGTSNADRQRRLAALMALRSYALEGDPRFLREELRDRSRTLGIYDRANFSTNLRDFQYENTRVFTGTDDGWRVTAPGLRYVADTLRQLVGRVTSS